VRHALGQEGETVAERMRLDVLGHV
jgi:hypothetical protein